MSTIALRTKPVAEVVDEVEDVVAPIDTSADHGNWITLRRSGQSPYRFKGDTIVESTGYYAGSRLWHEINIHKNSKGSYVLDLRVFKKRDDDKDVFRVKTFSTIDEVKSYLEAYNPSDDVKITFDSSDDALSTSQLTLHAVSLRQATSEAERDYHALVGDLLYQLESALPQ